MQMEEMNKANKALELFAALRKSIANEVNAKKFNVSLALGNESKERNKLEESDRKNGAENNISTINISNKSEMISSGSIKTLPEKQQFVMNLSQSEEKATEMQETKATKQIAKNNKLVNDVHAYEILREANSKLRLNISEANQRIRELEQENSLLREKLETGKQELESQQSLEKEHKEVWQKQNSLLERQKRELTSRLYEAECCAKETERSLQMYKECYKANKNNNNNKNNNGCEREDATDINKIVTSEENSKYTQPLVSVIGESSREKKGLQMCIANLKDQVAHLQEQNNQLIKIHLDAALRGDSYDTLQQSKDESEEDKLTREQEIVKKRRGSAGTSSNTNHVCYVNEEVKKLFVALRTALHVQLQEQQKERDRANELLYSLEDKLASLEEDEHEKEYE